MTGEHAAENGPGAPGQPDGAGPACPACGEHTVAGATFCEACGAVLDAGAAGTASGAARSPVDGAVGTCVACGSGAADITDGYCMVCGHKQPDPRDHVRADLGFLAGVSDRGRRHRHNEDSMALAALPGGGAAVVVCDGVSSTERAHEASQAAADAALPVLVDAAGAGRDLAVAMADAVAAAQAAVLAVGPGDEAGHPSCTFVAAVLTRSGPEVLVTVGWLGDSRAYWLGDRPEQLTTDHSWAAELVAAGALSEAEAMAHPHAHTITRWIGADAPEPHPDTVAVRRPTGGRLVVCSDGLWNYVAEAAALAAREEWAEAGPLGQAVALTAYANDSGGHDNITVVVVDTSAGPGDGPPPADAVPPAPREGAAP